MEDKFRSIRSNPNIRDAIIDDEVVIHKSYILSEDKIKLHYITASNKNKQPYAQLAIIPGTYEFSINYLPFAGGLAQVGIDCHILDLRGCGLSGGCRHSLDMIGMQLDVVTLLSKAKSDNTYILANSASCTVLLSLLLNNPHIHPSGVILWSPYLEMEDEETGLLMILYKIVKAHINVI